MHTSLISIPGIISCVLLLLWTISLSLPYLRSSEDALLGAKSTQAGNTDQRLRGFSEPGGVVVSHGLGWGIGRFKFSFCFCYYYVSSKNFFYFNDVFIEIIVDSHTVVRYNRKRSHLLFTHFTPMVTSYQTIVRYHNQVIDIDITQWSYSDFPNLLVLVCMDLCACVVLVLHNFTTCVVSCIYQHSWDTE